MNRSCLNGLVQEAVRVNIGCEEDFECPKKLLRWYFQIADLQDGLFQMEAEKIANSLTESEIFKDQGADVGFPRVIDNQIALTGHLGIAMHILENANFTPDSVFSFIFLSAGPQRRPILQSLITHQWMVTEFHSPNKYQSVPMPVKWEMSTNSTGKREGER